MSDSEPIPFPQRGAHKGAASNHNASGGSVPQSGGATVTAVQPAATNTRTLAVSEPASGATSASLTAPSPPPCVAFDRRELNQVLGLYGRKVAQGEWRDYAIDMLKDRAVFSIFRRSSEFPIYRIEKNPKLARRQGAYSVISASGQILKRGHELDRVLKVLDRRVKLVEV